MTKTGSRAPMVFRRHRVVKLWVIPYLCSVLLVTAQSVPWGEPQHGLQIRLVTSDTTKKTAPQRPGEWPALEIQLRNVAQDEVTLSNLRLSAIVVDDLRFGALTAGDTQVSQKIAPGLTTATFPLSLPAALYELNDIGYPASNCPLRLAPGKHTVRVAFSGSVLDVNNGRPAFSVFQVSLESNPIMIEIPGTSGELRSASTSAPHPCAPRA